MKTLVVLMIAVVIWLAGINGNLGSILAAIIDPSSLVDGSNPSNTTSSGGGSSNSPLTSTQVSGVVQGVLAGVGVNATPQQIAGVTQGVLAGAGTGTVPPGVIQGALQGAGIPSPISVVQGILSGLGL